ncbi:MAG: LPXTG cell wall anchor domain-containing protein [Candidatus Pacebacteria bacterium]|nr:LPXTG cell wall anchor domain-containing protein [Candidatus Paceibacterota bacterium]
MKKILIIIAVIFGIVSVAQANTSSGETFHYVFHLYYDAGKLNTDRDFKFKYDVIPGDFSPDSLGTQFPYHAEVVNLLNETVSRFDFDPRQGDVSLNKGKISVSAPYFADGQKVIFYDNQNQSILTVPVSESSFCNDDGICNVDKGEDYSNCSKDCKNSLPVPSQPPLDNTTSAGAGGSIWSSVLYLFGGLILAGLAWWFYKRRQRTNSASLPDISLPTPTTPTNTGNNV